MKKNLFKIAISLFLLFAMQSGFAQTRDSVVIRMQKAIELLQKEMESQKTDFSKRLYDANENIKSLRSEVAAGQKNLKIFADSLNIQMTKTQNQAEQQIYGVQQTLNKNSYYWIIIILAVALLSAVFFWLLRLKQKSDKTDIIAQLNQTKSIINAEPDHSLALKVASEINLIERNIKLMDTDTKGLKQLVRSMEKMKHNLAANGYEVPSLLGRQFHEGMKVIVVNSIPGENLETGTEIITKILVPQVNYSGIMIQTAQIEVSVGY